MYLPHFGYHAPKTSAEALDLINCLGKKAKLLAGGTDLLIMMKEKLIRPEYLIDINSIEEIKNLSYKPDEGAVIGAAVKISEVENSPLIKEKYYALHQAAGELGSVQVRTMATIGGNSCHASPAAETPTPLVALGAKVILGSSAGKRELPLEEFILGNRLTALKDGEMLTHFILPDPAPRSASRYRYIGLRDAMEIDAVNMAVYLVLDQDGKTIKDLKLTMGSVSPRPLVSVEAPKALIGKEFGSELLDKAVEAVSSEAKPISDIRASSEYRREMTKVLAHRLLQEAYNAARGVSI